MSNVAQAAALGVRNPALTPLTHAAANDVGMKPAHYAVHVEARRTDNSGRILLRMGAYTQTWLASHDVERLNTLLEQRGCGRQRIHRLSGLYVFGIGAPNDDALCPDRFLVLGHHRWPHTIETPPRIWTESKARTSSSYGTRTQTTRAAASERGPTCRT
ncbi:hypothetical protein [Streptomyces afghaniensis]|uniref:hypothetical protein n=1 Tax=Streptomyces afghaniensis TaxID=66865 RepID=UPI00378DE6C4